MIALSRSVFDNSSVIKKLTFDLFIKDDVDNKVYNEIERNIMDIGLGKITKEQIAFNFLNENDKPEFFVHFKKMVVSISDIFLDLKEALNGN